MPDVVNKPSIPPVRKWAKRVAVCVWVASSLFGVFAATAAVVDRTVAKTFGFAIVAAVVGPLVIWLMWREDFHGIASAYRYRRTLKLRDPLSSNEFY